MQIMYCLLNADIKATETCRREQCVLGAVSTELFAMRNIRIKSVPHKFGIT